MQDHDSPSDAAPRLPCDLSPPGSPLAPAVGAVGADRATGRRAMLAGIGGLAAGAMLTRRAAAGPLDPPVGPIASTPGPEPRTPIGPETTPGNAGVLYKITHPGSYYLTGNVQGVADKHGIQIAADGVTLDLMGFAVLGVGGAATLSGIMLDFARNDITVRNGTVRGWSGNGVYLLPAFGTPGEGALVEGVAARDNAGSGIRVGHAAVVRACTAIGSSLYGISAGEGAVIDSCVARSCGEGIITGEGGAIVGCAAYENGTGITADGGSTVSNCSAAFNTIGIFIFSGSTVTDSTANSNSGDGISTDAACAVSGCMVRGNGGAGIRLTSGSVSGCTVDFNGSHGIRVLSDTLIRGNNCKGNGSGGEGAGILCAGTDNRVEDNTCMRNKRGVQANSGGNFIVRNTCSGNTEGNWQILVGNKCLVVNGVNGAGVNGDAGGVSPGSTDPWANFTY